MRKRVRSVKILATLGPASDDARTVRALIDAGADAFRLNMSHGEPDEHRALVRLVREAAEAADRPVGLLVDLGGPKIRTRRLKGGSATLEEGSEVEILAEEVEGTARAFSTTLPQWIEETPPNSRILLDDGRIELVVLERSSARIRARVVSGGELGEGKGVNLPGVPLSMPALTEKDHRDVTLAVEAGADWLALSFVRSFEDVRAARAAVAAAGGDLPILAKIEKSEAVDTIDAILEEANGVLVARGDLGVETSVEEVPLIQKRILARANETARIGITATQMLQSMMSSRRPTRAEASDVANAVLDGSDGLLLTGETAVGRYPVEVVETMDRIALEAERSPLRRTRLATSDQRISGSYRFAIAEAAAFAAREMNLELIVVFTLSGTMARHIAALRPRRRILAFTPSETTRRRLTHVWGVEPHRIELDPSSESMIEKIDRVLVSRELARAGDEVILMAGRVEGIGLSRMMKVHRVVG